MTDLEKIDHDPEDFTDGLSDEALDREQMAACSSTYSPKASGATVHGPIDR